MRSIAEIIKKLKEYASALVELLRERVNIRAAKNHPPRLIKFLQDRGISIDDDVLLFSPETLNIDMTRPSLVRIQGGGTFIHRNFTILTHDYATHTFLHRYGEFVPCSGKVSIGKNVWFGMNVTCLKGTDIGDNCIIGYGSVVMGKIPANSVAAGCPARVICSLDDYFNKRKQRCVDEAFEYARSIQERFGRRPVPADFWEEFPLFVSGDEVNNYPEIPIQRQMKGAFNHFVENHKAPYSSFDEFLKAAGL